MEKSRAGWNWWGPVLAVTAGLSLALGAIMQAVLGAGQFWPGALAGALLIFLAGLIMVLIWRQAGSGKSLACLMIAAFMLRIILGVFLAWGLPQFGYEEPSQQAGFVFFDAFQRDGSAWELAKSSEPLSNAFGDEFSSDQYGGLLWMSALVYRFLSPNTYRPGLILILSAAAMALSVPFFVQFVRRRFGHSMGAWAGWILVLYPEGLLLGASQMREPFYILFFCIILWAAGHWLDRSRLKIVLPAALISALLLFLLSYRVAVPILGAVLIFIWLEETKRIEKAWVKVVGWAVIGVTAALSLYLFRDWLIAALNWDSYLTVRGSGMVQYLLERLPGWSQIPFIVAYGILQPVLPAAIVAPAPWIWKSIAVFRAVGWYALIPFLIYAAVRVWKARPNWKRMLMFFLLVSLTWTLVASVRAGGDQWDNPRYRLLLLPWMAVIAAWVIQFAKQHQDYWFRRVLILEGVFVVFFTLWYLMRYIPALPSMDFMILVGMIIGVSALVIVGGIIQDRRGSKGDLTDRSE